jgi:predicted nicotinamide N-methyase
MDFKPVRIGEDPYIDFEYYDYRYYSAPGLLIEDLSTPISIIQFQSEIIAGCLWDASYVLAKYMDTLSLANKSIIELGSGLGLASILCSTKGADVTATDLPSVLPLLSSNIHLNQHLTTGTIVSDTLDWQNSSDISRLSAKPWDFVIMSDVFYLPVTRM